MSVNCKDDIGVDEFDSSSERKFAGGFRSLHDKVPRESETQNPRLLSQQRYDDAQFLNDHHMHSFIEGSIPDKFQNDQMIRYGAESLTKRIFVILHACWDKFDKQMETYENM